MKHKRKWIVGLLSATLLFLVIVKFENLIVVGKEKEQLQSVIEVDYTHIDSAVDEALKEEPEILSKIKAIHQTNISAKKSAANVPVTDLIDHQKTTFRLKVENKLMNGNVTDQELQQISEKNNALYLKALDIAENSYDVTVTQEEVTKHIKENIATVKNEDKEKYAKALGLTIEELDYIFDRDLYVIDTLWEKVIPVLMEMHPQISDIERIKEEFYAN